MAWLLWAGAAGAQVLQGQWVDDAQERIEAHRMTGLRVIVLNADGTPAAGAQVRVQQVAHDFRIGCVFDDRVVMGMDLGDPVLRVFNTLSMQPLTRWSAIEPMPDDVRGLDRLDTALAGVSTAGRTILWGPVVSADPAQNPDWLSQMNAQAVQASVGEHAGVVMTVFGKRIEGCDLYADALDHDMLEQASGGSVALVRQMYQRARFLAPDVKMGLRLRDGLSPGRVGPMVDRVVSLERQVVPFDTLTIEQRFDRAVQPRELLRGLERVAALGKPITLAELEVSGATPVAAAINLETVLRLAFAEPAIQGVIMKTVRPEEGSPGSMALLDETGEPTASGRLMAGLFNALWWTDSTLPADELGNVYARVYAGRYHVSATLPGDEGGEPISAKVHIPKADHQQVVVLQRVR